MSLSSILQQYDVFTSKKETGVKYWTELMKQHNALEKNVTVDDLRKSLKLLKTGMSRGDFPGHESEAAKFCEEIVKDIIQRMKKLDPDANGGEEADKFYSDCLDFIVTMLETGPGTTHLLMIDNIRGYCEGYRFYYHFRMTPNSLRPLLRALTREFTSKEPGFNYATYSKVLCSGFYDVVDRKKHPRAINTMTQISKEMYMQAQEDFVELYMFHETSFLSRDEKIMDTQRFLSQMICSLYENGIFYGMKNVDVFRRHLSRLQQVIGQADFPQSDKTLKIVMDVLHDLLVAVKGGNLFVELSSDILSFLVTICKDKHGCSIHSLVEEVGILYTGVADTKGNSGLFEAMTPAFGLFLDQLTDRSFLDVVLVKPAVCKVICGCMNNSKEHASLLIGLLKSLLKIPMYHCADTAQTVLAAKDKFLKWKPHVADAQRVLDLITDIEISGDPDDTKEALTKFYVSILSLFLEQTKRDRVIKELNERMVNYCLKCLTSRSKFMFRLGSEVATKVEFNIKKEKTLMFNSMKSLRPLLEDADFRWDLPASRNIAQTLAAQAMDAITDAKILSDAEVDILMSVTMSVTQRDFINPDNNTPDTVFYDLYSTVGTRLCKMIDNPETAKKASQLISKIVTFMSNEFEQIQSLAISHVASIASKEAKALAPHMEAMVKLFVEEENTELLFPIAKVYPSNPAPLAPHFSAFFDLMDSRDDDVKEPVLLLMTEVAQRQPKLFEDDHITTIIEEMKSAGELEQSGYLTILLHLSQQRPDVIVEHTTTLTQAELHKQQDRGLLLNVLKNVAVRSSMDEAEPVVEYYTKLLSRPEDGELSPHVLNAMRAVGAIHRPLLDNRKSFIADLRDTTRVQSVKDTCTFILDILEGRSLEALSADMKGVKQEVGHLGGEVTSTRAEVDNVQNDVTVQKARVERAEVRMDYQKRELRELAGTVEDTVTKVDEIDKKTLSHAPFWARDVSRLLNPESKHDWRLLSSRLGYSKDDIRGWVQTADPCQSMLNEWYSTNKTRDATFGVLQALQEMNRADAAVIVENAMKMAETIVEDDPQDYKSPPDIFISYQWGKQPEVQLLQRHLASAGYSCWLDIGQMGGGDKLFEKIDRGIRAATVVLCCVTDKYAGSPNCNREVNLAVTLGKPIIPLLLEKCTWPPPGSMGPIFSEYLFIRFFSRPGEEVEKGAFWSKAKFRELLLQLSYNKVEVSLHVEPEYKNWWGQVPATDHIPQKETSGNGGPSKTTATTTAQKTDVFLSYQWGKQPQIQKLFARLTSLGYTCWMDVHQMGGGDSLFDKIDKGVRGSMVVISCVTTKYCLSANCRREVSLADALKKPIVPLLLEPTAWPPSGPMSMVLTPLVYIDLSKNERVQESWEGGKADELVRRIQDVINPQGEDTIKNDAQYNRQGQTTPRSTKSKPNATSRSCVLV